MKEIAPMIVVVALLMLAVSGVNHADEGRVKQADQAASDRASVKSDRSASEPQGGTSQEKKSKDKWVSLFDGKTLKGWSIPNFGGQGAVSVEDGTIVLELGNDLTGITWKDEKTLPRTNYEISLEAMRVEGSDFFCGLTFPVKDDPCSLIIGGWGGGVCGLSTIDGLDASENDTTYYRPFEKGKWYKIRLRVTDDKISAWIDDKEIVEQDLEGRKISIRFEVELSQPLGIASWQTTAAIRKIRLRRL